MAFRAGMGNWWSDLVQYNTPAAWGTALADTYQQLQYGSIPAPGAGLPSPPVAAAPGDDQMLTWDPAAAEAATSKAWGDWLLNTRKAIVDAEKSGAYNPQGNLPLTAEGFSKYGGWLIGGGLALVGLLAWKGRR